MILTAPYIGKIQRDIKVIQGNEIAIPCYNLLGGILPDFRWLRWKGQFNQYVLKTIMSGSGKIDKSIVEVIGADRYRQVKKKSQRLNSKDIYGVELVFPKVSMSDAGLYTCVVMNHLGYDYKTTKLSVL